MKTRKITLKQKLLALRHSKKFNPYGTILVVVVTVGLVGLVLTLASRAATFSTALEVENGTKTGNQGPGLTTGASNNQSVKFGTSTTPPPTTPPGDGGDGAADPSDCPNTAAAAFNWGAPQYQSNFNTPTLDPRWHPYGPEPGHNDEGTRTPAAFTMGGGNVTLSADGNGTTGAMKFFPGQQQGRWEVCMKVATGNQHAVALTWPDIEDWPQGGELDFFEGGTFFFHCPGSSQTHCDSGDANVDTKQWHAVAMEWTNSVTKGYVDGKEFFSHNGDSPPRPMDLCIQLDPGDGGSDAMIVDWTKQWPVSGSTPSTLGLKPGERATGHPDESATKQYAPRAMTVRQMLGLDP